MKTILFLCEDRKWKSEINDILKKANSENAVKGTFVSTRADMISEVSLKSYDAVVLNSSLNIISLEIIFKYLATTEYKDIPLFFISKTFSDFEELLNQSHFTNLHLIPAPVETPLAAKNILSVLFPLQTHGPVDKDVKINLEFLKAIVDSTKFILESFCLVSESHHEKPYIYNYETADEYAIEGDIALKSAFFEGRFTIGLKKETYLTILKGILGSDEKVITKENADFAGEIVNMVYGQAKTILNVSGHDFEKVIPTYTLMPSKHKTNCHIVVVPLKTSAGPIDLLVEVKKI